MLPNNKMVLTITINVFSSILRKCGLSPHNAQKESREFPICRRDNLKLQRSCTEARVSTTDVVWQVVCGSCLSYVFIM